jgi:hypothetical protein
MKFYKEENKNKSRKLVAGILLSLLLFENCSHLNIEPVSNRDKNESASNVQEVGSLPAVIYLGALNGKQGLIIEGGASGEVAGISVSGTGDVNADGIDDIIIGASNPYAEGRSYIIYGQKELPAKINLGTLNSTQGTIIQGLDHDYAGTSVSGAGDVNGDGIKDIIIGAYATDAFKGASYIVYGSQNLPAKINLATLRQEQGVTIKGAGGSAGLSVSGAGDINGDGIDDTIIGAYNMGEAGTSYVVYGGKNLPAEINLASLDGAQGITIGGAAVKDNQSGYSVSKAGDVNGDGIDDVIIGAANIFGTGSGYIVYGSKYLPSKINLAALQAIDGMVITNLPSNIYYPASVSSAGDVNGDGINDVIIGAGSGGNNARGVSYIIYGSNSLPSNLVLPPSVSQGITINGVNDYDFSGVSVSGAGDINGDGMDDVIIGAPYAGNKTGASYLVYGNRHLPANISLASLGRMQGITIWGASKDDYTGSSVSGAGDINGDGIDDIVIGATGVNSQAGTSYIIYGSPSNQTSITSNILDSAKKLCNNLAAWWHAEIKQPNLDTADKEYVQSMLSLKDKCQAILKEASNETEDKWYAYSIEDMIEDIDAVLQNGKGIDKHTLRSFKRRLAGIQKDFLAPAVDLSPEQKATLKSIAGLSNVSAKEPKEQLYMLATDVINSLPSYAASSIPALP